MSDSLAGLDTWRRAAAEAGARATAVIARLTRSSQNWPTNTATRDDLSLKESGLTTVVREASALLSLIAYFAADQEKEARAAPSALAPAPCGLHSDIENGFVAAEIVPRDELVRVGVAGSSPAAPIDSPTPTAPRLRGPPACCRTARSVGFFRLLSSTPNLRRMPVPP